MKRNSVVLRLFSMLLLIAVLLAPIILPVSAESILDSLPLSPQSIDGRKNAYQKVTSVSDGEKIVAFDVSEEMGILLITSKSLSSECHLRHMDASGNLISVFSFICTGTVGVAWDDEDICVFFSRGNMIDRLDCDGTLKESMTLLHHSYETSEKWDAMAHHKEKSIGTGTYLLRAKGLFPIHSMYEFTQIVFRDAATGNEQVLYDASKAAMRRSLANLIVFGVFVFAVVMGSKKARKKADTGDTGDGSI